VAGKPVITLAFINEIEMGTSHCTK